MKPNTGKIAEIFEAKLKPKEKVAIIVDAVKRQEITAKEFIAYFKSGTDVEKGTLADAMKHISEAAPEILAPYTADLIEFINYPAPRVKWGVPEAIGNIARKYPEKVEGTIPKLLLNTEDASTVIRWCAAYGLTEIARYNPKTNKQLILFFESMVKSEKNNGVRNVYVKTLKVLQKNK